MAINPQKLLPPSQSKGGSLAKVSSSNLSLNVSIKKIDTKKLIGSKDDEKEFEDIKKTLINIDSLLKSLLSEDKKKQSKKRKEKENADFQKEEQKLEAPKESKKFNLPSLSVPGMGFLDRIKRFIFFTALGWLFTKFQDQLPKLLGIVKVIGGIYNVAENIFKFLLETFVNFIDRGYKIYDKTREIVKGIGGEKAEKEFDNLSGKLNEYINYVLIGGMALTGAIKGFNSQSKKVAEKVTANATKAAARTTEGVAARTAGKVASGTVEKVGGKIAVRQLLRVAKGPLTKFPVVGGLIEFGLSAALGDPLGKAAFRGVGTVLLGAVGSLILPGFGTFALGWVGAELAAKLYEVLFENKKPTGQKKPIQKKASGGPVTRGGVSINRPIGRTSGTQQRKRKKLIPQPTKPGKNVGGEKKIKKLYQNPDDILSVTDWMNATDAAGDPLAGDAQSYKKEKEKNRGKRPNPYKALTNTAKILKEGGEAGILMAAGVDLAMGQDLGNSFMNFFSKDTLLKSKVNEVIQNIKKELSKKIMGGGNEPTPLGGGGGTAGGEYNGYSPPSGIQKEIYDYLINVKKLSDVQALGLMANINRESSFIPSQMSGDDGGSGGLFQWKIPRSNAMAKAVPDWKKNWKGQIDYALREPGEPGSQYISTRFSSSQEAADWWMQEWERPKDKIGASREHAKYLRGIQKAPDGTAKFREGENPSVIPRAGNLPRLPSTGQLAGQNYGAPRKYGGHSGQDYDISGNEKFYSRLGGEVIYVGAGYGKEYGNIVEVYNKDLNITEVMAEALHIMPGIRKGMMIAAGTPVVYGERPQTPGVGSYGVVHYEIVKGRGGITIGSRREVQDPKQFLSSKRYNDYINSKINQPSKPGQPPKPGQDKTGTEIAQPDSRQKIVQALTKKSFIPFTFNGNPYVFKMYNDGHVRAWPSISLPFNDPLPNFLTKYGTTGISPDENPGMSDEIRKKISTMYKMQGGGLIEGPNRRNYSSLSSYPSYDSGGGMMLAIQPIIIEKPVPVSSGGNKTIMFPVVVGVNNSNMASLNRG
jgi:hypothetical protein